MPVHIFTDVPVDTIDPTAPGSLVVTDELHDRVTLDFGAPSVDTNFDRYRLFYTAGDLQPLPSDSEFTHSSLLSIDYGGATSITVTGLTQDTEYSFILYAYDTYGNHTHAVAHTVGNTSVKPPVTFVHRRSSSGAYPAMMEIPWLTEVIGNTDGIAIDCSDAMVGTYQLQGIGPTWADFVVQGSNDGVHWAQYGDTIEIRDGALEAYPLNIIRVQYLRLSIQNYSHGKVSATLVLKV